ncbi:hypothetical protein [Actinokineospora diospyrosa]|uniref:LppP/LprE lipoprotein n=1 Tax=Actinokineospora diospyrosa TaxID=103728 RepID=A0ABT1ILK6_9PSEU|nr:hypothetical protein [Actinokineospora diospyrosa]MCP2273536.1 hypothetical protein [Actinokineospora diospyrosa]
MPPRSTRVVPALAVAAILTVTAAAVLLLNKNPEPQTQPSPPRRTLIEAEGCARPEADYPTTYVGEQTGPMLPTDLPDAVWVCPLPDNINLREMVARDITDEAAEVLSTVNSLPALPAQTPNSACTLAGGYRFDLVFHYGYSRHVVQADTGGCGVVHSEGQFRLRAALLLPYTHLT